MNAWNARAIQLALLVLFLALWELGARNPWPWEPTSRKTAIDRFFYSAPSDIALTLWDWITSGVLWADIAITMQETLMGFVLGTIIGVTIGFVLARSEWLSAIFAPVLVLLNGMPRVILAPLFILWFGTALASKVAMSTVLVVFVVFFATYSGIKEVDPNIVDNARILGARGRDLTRHVLIPSALTWIFTSLRTSVGFALVGAVVAEYIVSTAGVGRRIAFSQAMYDATGVYAGLVVLMVLVALIDNLIRRIEDRFSVWKPPRPA